MLIGIKLLPFMKMGTLFTSKWNVLPLRNDNVKGKRGSDFMEFYRKLIEDSVSMPTF